MKKCAICSAELTGKRRVYCGQRCSDLGFYRRRVADGRMAEIRSQRAEVERERLRGQRINRTCVVCGQAWLTRRSDARYCSVLCRSFESGRTLVCPLPERTTPRTATCERCSHPFGITAENTRKRFCSRACAEPRAEIRTYDCLWCGTQFQSNQATSRFCGPSCKARRARAQRRARAAGAGGEFTWAEVMRLHLAFERRCAYCDSPGHGQPDPDHVVPLSRGGHNSITNILPACRTCNSDKRNLLLAEWAIDRARRGKPPVRTDFSALDSRWAHLTSVRTG